MSDVNAAQALPADYARSFDAFRERWDLPLAVAIASLLGLGLVMVTSASVSPAARELGDPLYF